MNSAGSLSYLPSLDALRAFAVVPGAVPPLVGPPDLPLGPIGVWIFFVLSGFLITRILLTARADHRMVKTATPCCTSTGRRFLRIFPLYYFVLLLGWFLSEALRRDWPWYVTYLQNYRMIWASDPDGCSACTCGRWPLRSSFTSFWPLLMLFLPRVLLLPTIGFAITSAITLRAVLREHAVDAVPRVRVHAEQPGYAGAGCDARVRRDVRADRIIAVRRVALCAGVVIGLTGSIVHTRSLGAALDAGADGALRSVLHRPRRHGVPGERPATLFRVSAIRLSGPDQLWRLHLSLLHPRFRAATGLKDGSVPFVALCSC
jgi:peptidoglycan/LPS O-acetylase OafA/YrhL